MFWLARPRVLRGLVYLLLAAIPFSKAAIEILFPLVLIGWGIRWHLSERGPFRVQHSPSSRTVGFFLLAYVGVCAWSISSSTHPFLSLSGFLRKTAEYALLFFILRDVTNHPEVARRSFRVVLISAWFVAIYAVIQQVTGRDLIRGKMLEYSRMTGPYENPNDLATFLMVVSLLVIAQLLERPKPSIGLWAAGGLFLACLSRTLSRGALIGFWVGLAFLWFYSKEKKKWMVPSIVVVTGALGLFFRKEQLLQMISFSDIGLKERYIMWDAGWRMFQDRPFLGQGLNTFMANYLNYAGTPNNGPAYAHNCFLQIAAETGVVGLVAFLLFLIFLFRLCGKALREKTESGWTLFGFSAGIVAFLVQSFFDTNLYSLRQSALFWSMAGLMAGLSNHILSVRKAHIGSMPPSTPTTPKGKSILQRV